MKNSIPRIGMLLSFLILNSFYVYSQSAGDLAIIGFNADGDDDLAILVLADISTNTTIYFTDRESDGSGGFTSGEGTLVWDTGSNTVPAGTVVIFTDINSSSNPNFGSSIGSLSSSGSFSLPASSKDGIIVYKGSNIDTPSTFITAIQLGNDASTLGPFDVDGITLSNTGLVIGTSIIVFDDSASPDGAVYNASRSSQVNYSDYYTLISDDSSNWTNVINGDGESLLPFSQESFTIHTTNWTGNTSNIWNLAGNWDNGIPTFNSLVNIPDVSNTPIINSGVEAKVGNLTISIGETLTIDNLNSLKISGLLNINGNLILNSGSSLISYGTSTGNAQYLRNLPTNNWYLVSSPFQGETIENLISNHTFATGVGNNIGLANYLNDGTSWSYKTLVSTGSINSGEGYSIKLNSAGNLSFEGSLPTSNIQTTITSNATSYNLIGNPYPSYLAVTNSANSDNNLLKLNDTDNDYLTEATIWIWDESTNSYDQINHATGSYYLAPAQGFFVSSNGSHSFKFTESMQSHQTTDTFQKNFSPHPNIFLQLSDETLVKSTKIYYLENVSTSFDNGYDSSIFMDTDNSFAIYTNTVSQDSEKQLGIQSLPNTNFENMIIPIGINAEKGKTISISAKLNNIPDNLNIYLEDRIENSFTLLNSEESNLEVTLTESIQGTGRFYLHTTSNTLGNSEPIHKEWVLSIKNKKLYLNEITKGSMITVYNFLGQNILESKIGIDSNLVIDLNHLPTGFYIIQMTSESSKWIKKIALH